MKPIIKTALVLAAATALPLGACSVDEVLEVTDPDIVNPNDLQSAAGAAAAFAGGVGDFSFAITGDHGGTEGQIQVGGSMADELMNSETFPTRQEYENRSINPTNGTLTTVFRNLQRARFSLENAIALLEQYAPTPASRLGEAFALAGYTYVFFGEHFCSGVPFSSINEDPPLGQPRTTTEIFNLAVERFDSALVYLTGTDTASVARARLARVGKARALLDLGQFSAAAAIVPPSAVPTSFRHRTTHTITTSRQNNGVHSFTWVFERFSVADGDGGNGLNFRSANDPRVRVDRTPANNVGFDNSTPQYNPLKYPARTTPVGIADGIEARLIEAEAALQASGGPGMLTALNALRDDSVNNGGFRLPALADPGNQTGYENLLFRERAYWMFLTGHRLGDLRRLMRQYGRAEDAVFPTGVSPKGVVYGNDVNLPVPFDEQNNPNYTTPCSQTTP